MAGFDVYKMRTLLFHNKLVEGKMTISLPAWVEFALEKLNKKGYLAYVVGGSVRDIVMGGIPNDWDITTNAKPEQIKAIFDKTVDTGLKHGTVSVFIDNNELEITTFRKEGKYSDKRHPDIVEFVDNVEEDLKRRDFTINALCYNHKEGVVDIFNGLEDIKNKTVRCIGNPDDRFNEDALRMIRAIRFSTKLDFQIEKNTFDSIIRNCSLINYIANERVNDEFSKILISNSPSKGVELLRQCGLLNILLPELQKCFGVDQQNPYHVYDVYYHILKTLESVENRLDLRLVMLLHDIGKPATKTIDNKGVGHFYGHAPKSAIIAKDILLRFKYSNEMISKVTTLIDIHDDRIKEDTISVKRFIAKRGWNNFWDYIKVRNADINGQNKDKYAKSKQSLDAIYQIAKYIETDKEPLFQKDLAVDGTDLISTGLKEGKEIGEILESLLKEVIINPKLNNKEKLLTLAREKW